MKDSITFLTRGYKEHVPVVLIETFKPRSVGQMLRPGGASHRQAQWLIDRQVQTVEALPNRMSMSQHMHNGVIIAQHEADFTGNDRLISASNIGAPAARIGNLVGVRNFAPDIAQMPEDYGKDIPHGVNALGYCTCGSCPSYAQVPIEYKPRFVQPTLIGDSFRLLGQLIGFSIDLGIAVVSKAVCWPIEKMFNVNLLRRNEPPLFPAQNSSDVQI